MKRCWFGVVLLVVLLAASLVVSWAMGSIHKPISADLQRAAEEALLGDLTQARSLAVKAKAGWKKWEHFRACFADHTPMEEISAGFAELEIYGAAGEDAAFAAKSAELAEQVKAVGEAHGLVWWNLF